LGILSPLWLQFSQLFYLITTLTWIFRVSSIAFSEFSQPCHQENVNKKHLGGEGHPNHHSGGYGQFGHQASSPKLMLALAKLVFNGIRTMVSSRTLLLV